MTRAGRMVTRWRACNINQRSSSKESRARQQQRLEGGTGTAGGRRGFWSNGTGSSIEETTAGQGKRGGSRSGGGHISWDPGVRRGTIGHVVLRDRGQEKGESLRGRIQEGANKTQGGRLVKARLNGSMASRTGTGLGRRGAIDKIRCSLRASLGPRVRSVELCVAKLSPH